MAAHSSPTKSEGAPPKKEALGSRATYEREAEELAAAMDKYAVREEQDAEMNDLRTKHLNTLNELGTKRKRLNATLAKPDITQAETDRVNKALCDVQMEHDQEQDDFKRSLRHLESQLIVISDREWLFIRGERARREKLRFAPEPPSAIARSNARREKVRERLEQLDTFFLDTHKGKTVATLSHAEMTHLQALFHFCDFNCTGSVELNDMAQLCRTTFAPSGGVSDKEVELLLLRGGMDMADSPSLTVHAFFRFCQHFIQTLHDYGVERDAAAELRKNDAATRRRAVATSESERNALEESARMDLARIAAAGLKKEAAFNERAEVHATRRSARIAWAKTATVETVLEAAAERTVKAFRKVRSDSASPRRAGDSSPAKGATSSPKRNADDEESPTTQHKSTPQRKPKPARKNSGGDRRRGSKQPGAAPPPKSRPAANKTPSPTHGGADSADAGSVTPWGEGATDTEQPTGTLTLMEVRNELVDGPLPTHNGPVSMTADVELAEHVEDLFWGIAGSQDAEVVTGSQLAALLALYAVPRGCKESEAVEFIKYLHETSPTAGADPTVLTMPDFFVVASRVAARAMDGLFFATMAPGERIAAIELKRSMAVPIAGYEEAFEREHNALLKQHASIPRARPSSSFQSIGRTNRWVRPGLPDAPAAPRPSKLVRQLPRSEQPASARVGAPKPLALPAPPGAKSSRQSSAAPQRLPPRASSARRADDPLLATLRSLHGIRGPH